MFKKKKREQERRAQRVQCECGRESIIHVDHQDVLAWKSGTLAQCAFPYLSNDEREWLVSNTCPECFDDLFGGDDDDEEDE